MQKIRFLKHSYILFALISIFLTSCSAFNATISSAKTTQPTVKKEDTTSITTNEIIVKEEEIPTITDAEKVIEEAYTYNGTTYKYGGTTRDGMDCSGLVCRSFEAINMTLPRGSEVQSNLGKRIYIGEIRPGDLVFFATGSSTTKVTHVGLVTEVTPDKDIKFIHATTKKGVCSDYMSQEYYKTRYVKAVRLIE